MPRPSRSGILCLDIIASQGVSEAAIALQDAAGIDVNMILFLMWLSGQGETLAEADLRKLSETSHSWQRQVVVPIRNIRRLLKENAPFVEQETALAYRKKGQALEIEGEQLELNAMADAAKNRRLERGGIDGTRPRATISQRSRRSRARRSRPMPSRRS